MMQRRQVLLIALLAVVVIVVSYPKVESMVRAPLDARQQKKERLEKEIQKRRTELARARKAAKDLAIWQRESLPSDPQVARSAYQAWLLDLAGRSGLERYSVDAGEPGNRNGMVHPITFSIQGRGTLEQLSRFLYDFYRAGHLHQVRALAITPVSGKDRLDLSITIEALVLDQADRKDRLGSEKSDRLAFSKFDDYRVIVERNFFGSGGAADPTDQTYLTGVNYVNGEPVAWFTLRAETDPERSVLKLRKGDQIEIGQFRGKLVAIDEDDVILEADGERWLVAIGENLGEAYALPPGF